MCASQKGPAFCKDCGHELFLSCPVFHMTRLHPFKGLRYPRSTDPTLVTAPPYDVLDDEEARRFATAHPNNIVRVDLPSAIHREADPYRVAAGLLAEWVESGSLVRDADPTLTVHEMRYSDPSGRHRRTIGVIGAVEIQPEDGLAPLPHEHTTPKAAGDRLRLLRATASNLSAIWLLSTASGLADLLEAATAAADPWWEWEDQMGVHHRVHVLEENSIHEKVSSLVAGAPVLIADGHHRFETARIYRDARRTESGPGPWDLVMAYVVELAEEELSVGPIHRLVWAQPTVGGLDALVSRLREYYAVEERSDRSTPRPPALVTHDRHFLLTPLERGDLDLDLDTRRFELAASPLGLRVEFEPSAERATSLAHTRKCDAAFLCRPPEVSVIRSVAEGAGLMPAKSTFFWPKPPTGIVIRPLD
ncbi:MAG: hypothetical protein KatS3mg008_0341 [Acidimicrobiales bacterium]|nr:MAG: hypothetical protein KatS3mg008_0341 [Acidimicrobiales bacterium]